MLSKSIIHIFNDDKFIDPTIKLFEEVIPGQSIYFVIKKNGESFTFVKFPLAYSIDLDIQSSKMEFINFINSNSNHVVFIHALDHYKQNIVLNISPSITKVWFIWGYDLYGNWKLLKNNIYLSETKSFLNLKSNLKFKLINNSFTFYLFQNQELMNKVNKNIARVLNNAFNTEFYRAAKLFDFVVPVVPSEFKIIQRMNLKAKFLPFTYGCIEDLLGDKIDKTVINQPNILIGNSADPSNNHVEVFLKLSLLDLKDSKVYVPLSYSGSESYVNFVLKRGHELLGNRFYPLIDFIPLVKYNEILLSCGTLIFNHVRQQGLGNIIVLGCLGAKVFLNNKSPIYSYYNSIG
ncbi:MAG: hypothetical protein EBS55_07695, partial [Flavobacteriaceae bacterium]|nr:hypothetical protein [Flavobacteriaceae bacterium]